MVGRWVSDATRLGGNSSGSRVVAETMDDFPYTLPGRKARVATRSDQIAATARGLALFGPRYLRLMAAARFGSRRRLRDAERRWLKHAARAVDLTVETHGLHQVDPTEQYVVTPLHEGFADVLALSHLPLDLTYAATDELFEWGFLGPYLRASGQTRVSPDDGAGAYRRIISSATKAFADGESYVVFPQGSILGIESSFRQGSFRLAATTGRPVLPVVLTGSSTIWEHPYSPNLRFHQTIRLEVLPPVDGIEAVHCSRDIEIDMKRRALAANPGPRRFEPSRDGWWDGYPYDIDPLFPELVERIDRHRGLKHGGPHL